MSEENDCNDCNECNEREQCAICNGGIEAFAANLDRMIAEHGHSIIGTGTDSGGGKTVAMSYTVGLSDKGFPELITFGLPQDVAQFILNDAAKLLIDGKLPVNEPVVGLANLPMIFKEVSPSTAEGYINVANRRAGRLLPALQMVIPDRNGLYPWNDGFDTAFLKLQRQLYA